MGTVLLSFIRAIIMLAKISLCGSVVFVLVTLAGCSTEQVQEAVENTVEQTTQAVEQTVETVKQEANLVGSMELQTDPPLASKACYVELIVTDDARPNVLRLASYKSTELERFPSMILEAQVEETSLADLAGKTVQAKVYAQDAQDGPVWSSPHDSPAALTITAVDENSLTCECAGSPLQSSENDEPTTVSGKFVALLN